MAYDRREAADLRRKEERENHLMETAPGGTLHRGSLHRQYHGRALDERMRRAQKTEADAQDDLLVLQHLADSLDLNDSRQLAIMAAALRVIARAVKNRSEDVD